MPRLVDTIHEDEVKVYYTGEVNTTLDEAFIRTMEKNGFDFLGMAHQKGEVHRMTFNRGWVEKE